LQIILSDYSFRISPSKDDAHAENWRHLGHGYQKAIKVNTHGFVSLALAVGAICLVPAISSAKDGAELFTSKCSGCHTIGKGPMVGPDLKEVSTWNESDIETNVKRMEKMIGPIPDDEVKALVRFLKQPDAAVQQAKAVEVQEKKESVDSEPASADEGAHLFFGETAFANGGTSCIACHSVQGRGGTLAKDLTNVYERMGKTALVSICIQPSFPAMKPIYTQHPITKQEAVHLAKFLETAGQKQSLSGDAGRLHPQPMEALGSAGALAVLAAIAFGYRNRKTGARSKLTRR
jgi:cytochrome c2